MLTVSPQIMASQTPQIETLNPKPHQNLQECPSQNSKANRKQQNKEANMNKLKEVVMKLCKMEPNKPLSDAHNTLIQNRLNHFLSSLHHTPDHPPYAWMIQRAIRELNEKGGSSEKSITKFICKEYDDLPWAHSTLLKHHLVNLCESGEVILTEGKCYLLAEADSTVKSSKKSRRKKVRRKRGYDWEEKRRKRRKKEVGNEKMLHKEDEIELIDEQRQSYEQEEQIILKQNRMIQGLKQQKLEADVSKESKDTAMLSVAGENGITTNASAQSTVPATLVMKDGKELPANFRLPQNSSESALEGRTDIYGPDAELEEGKQLEGDQIEPSTPERPPGFEFVAVEESYNSQTCSTKDSSQGTHPSDVAKLADSFGLPSNIEQLNILKMPLELYVLVPEGLSGHEDQIEVSNDHDRMTQVELQPVEAITINQLVEPKEYEKSLNSESPSAEGPVPCLQDKGTLGETQGTQANRDEEKVFLSSPVTPKTLQEHQLLPTSSSIDVHLIEYYEHPAKSTQAGPTELYSQQRLFESELTTKTNPSETRPVNFPGVEQVPRIVFQYQKRPPLPEVTKNKDSLCTVEQIKEDQLQQKQFAYQGQEHSEKNCTASSTSCILQHKQQENELSMTNELQEVPSGATNRLEHQEQQEQEMVTEHPIVGESQGLDVSAGKPSCEEHLSKEELRGLLGTPKMQHLMVVSPKLCGPPEQLNQANAHDFSDSRQPSEPGPVDIEESLQTEHMQGKKKHRSKRLSNIERPHCGYPAPMESTQVTDTQPKVCGRRKKNAGQPKTDLGLSAALQLVDSDELRKLRSSDSCPEQEPQIESSKHQQKKQVSQEKPPSRVLRARPLMSEVSNALTTFEYSPLVHHHEEQQQPKYHHRGRPPKAKPDTRITNDLGSAIHQNQHHLNQPPKGPKHESSEGASASKLLSKCQDEEQDQLELRSERKPPKPEVQQSELQRRGRPPKPEVQQSELPRRGRPPKPKPDTSVLVDSTTLNDQDHQQDHGHPEKPKKRGRGRHPKCKPVANTENNEKLLSEASEHKPKNRRRGRLPKTLQGE